MQILTLSASLIGLLDILCHCDLFYLWNSFVSVTVCYRSMHVITYVINQSCIQCMLLIYEKCSASYYSKHIVHITTWQFACYTYLLLIYDAWHSCCISIYHAHLHDIYLMHAYMFSIYDICYSILAAINSI